MTISLRLIEGLKTTYKDQKFSCLRWSKVVGDIIDKASNRYLRDFNKGCRLFGIHLAYMPKDLLKISFSIGRVGNVTYIAGICLITEKGPDICLGFISKGKEVIREAMALRGFRSSSGLKRYLCPVSYQRGRKPIRVG